MKTHCCRDFFGCSVLFLAEVTKDLEAKIAVSWMISIFFEHSKRWESCSLAGVLVGWVFFDGNFDG